MDTESQPGPSSQGTDMEVGSPGSDFWAIQSTVGKEVFQGLSEGPSRQQAFQLPHGYGWMALGCEASSRAGGGS